MQIYVIIKATLISSLLLVFFSCSKKSNFEFDVKTPKNLLINKDSILQFHIKIVNVSDKELIITNIESSCQCVILSKKKLTINSKSEDSISVELFGSKLGKKTEIIIFTNDLTKEFKLINLNYEVIP